MPQQDLVNEKLRRLGLLKKTGKQKSAFFKRGETIYGDFYEKHFHIKTFYIAHPLDIFMLAYFLLRSWDKHFRRIINASEI
jgi:hypothetical protein